MKPREYFASLRNAATTVFEGMAVTASHLFREPITIQYPDRMERPLPEMLPMRYRGLLEVQMDICTGCKRCEKSCPIDCIAIDLEKIDTGGPKKETVTTRFDIDMGKCMYCGLCVEACVAESTGAIRHTREFEAAASTLDGLLFRFIQPGQHFPLYKPPKDDSFIPVGEYGPHAREARERALRDNHAPLEKLREAWHIEHAKAAKEKKKAAAAGATKPAAGPDPAKVAEIKKQVEGVKPGSKAALPEYTAVPGVEAPPVIEKFARLLETLTAQTDCGSCQYPTCIDYSRALASGKDADPSKCEPGGAGATADLDVAVAVFHDRAPVVVPKETLAPPAPAAAETPASAPAAAVPTAAPPAATSPVAPAPPAAAATTPVAPAPPAPAATSPVAPPAAAATTPVAPPAAAVAAPVDAAQPVAPAPPAAAVAAPIDAAQPATASPAAAAVAPIDAARTATAEPAVASSPAVAVESTAKTEPVPDGGSSTPPSV
ncbi:MAG: 4Fe-4S dicluster domain-containing protein [Deltaproteobacteria bacterium]|nr:4Fe-4S dicluster domain-containing protein [Deltaproteobacteria bacterium]